MSESEFIFAIKGNISQKTSIFRTDRKLFGIVTDKVFSTYLDENYSILYKEIPLENIKLVKQLDGARPGFIITLENSTEELTYYCSSKHQAQKWICALQLKPVNNKVDLSDFELIKEIGQGGYATVYCARNRTTNELVAIKSIKKSSVTTDKHVAHVQSERNTLMRARHPFIIRLFNAFQTQSHLFFVLEFAQGGDLHYQLQRNILSFYQKKLYLAEIALAVKNLHSMGIIYRDLKPENILLDAKGHIKLTDFGTVKECTEDMSSASFCGTAEYLAPEVISGSVNQTYAIDWWSFGVIAFLFFTGSVPFSNPLRTRLFEYILHRQPRFTGRNLDPVTIDFLSQLLEKNPAKRLGSPGLDIFEHEFWRDIDWDLVMQCGYEPEFVPITDDDDPGYNFDSEDSTVEPDIFESPEIFPRIDGFSYEDLTVIA